MRIVAVVGPESTGKTTLAARLAKHYCGAWLPEYARSFLSDSRYTEEDVHLVAREQLAREIDFVRAKPSFGVLDTDAVVLRIWFAERFGFVPSYVDQHIKLQVPRLYLCLYPDLPWEYDPQRESKLDLRRLFGVYESTLVQRQLDYVVVREVGEQRTLNAIRAIDACWGLTECEKAAKS